VLEYANQENLREFLIKKMNCNEDGLNGEKEFDLQFKSQKGFAILNIAHRDLVTILLNIFKLSRKFKGF
jgi:hypothetical protein